MTIKARESLVLGLFIMATAVSAAFMAGMWIMGPERLASAAAMLPGNGGTVAFIVALSSAAACGMFASATLGVLAFKAGKSVSVEIFFFAVWCWALALEPVRGAVPWLLASGAGTDELALATRVLLFGRYLGSMSLCLGSLYSAGFRQERIDYALGAAILLATAFSSIHPLDTSTIKAGLYLGLGYAGLVRAFEILLLAVMTANYTIAWRDGKDRAFLSAGAGALACAVAAIVLQGAAPAWAAAAAVPLLAGGAWLHVKSLYRHYLWR